MSLIIHLTLGLSFLLLDRLPFFMKMAAQLMEKVLVGKYLTEFMTLMILSWLARILLMMGKRVCLPLVHFPEINLSLLLCLKMLLQVGE